MRLYTAADVRKELKKYIKENYGKPSVASRMWGVSPSYVTYMINGKRSIPALVLKEMGFETEVVYRRVK